MSGLRSWGRTSHSVRRDTSITRSAGHAGHLLIAGAEIFSALASADALPTDKIAFCSGVVMVSTHINHQLMLCKLSVGLAADSSGYKSVMKDDRRYTRKPGHPLGARILEAMGDDAYEDAAAKVQLAGGQASAPAMHKWVTKQGNITEPNVIAFCKAYGVRPAWLRYGAMPKKENEEDRRGIIESLPRSIKKEALDFIGYLIEKRGHSALGEDVAKYVYWIKSAAQEAENEEAGRKNQH